MTSPAITKYLKITVPAFPNETEYYKPITIPISITNVSSGTVLVDQIDLELQTEAGMVNRYIQVDCGHRIGPGNVHDELVEITPTPEFIENTCELKILVRFHEVQSAALGKACAEKADQSFFIINRRSSDKLGQLFISLKQPADEHLADILAVMARRAGFEPYMAKDDPQPGTDQWDRIETALKASCAAVILWTSRTQWGTGVEREIELCRSSGIPDVLLIEEGLEPPEAYRGTDIEYQPFNQLNMAIAFSRVISTRRRVVSPPIP
jgi:hypothetical protein